MATCEPESLLSTQWLPRADAGRGQTSQTQEALPWAMQGCWAVRGALVTSGQKGQERPEHRGSPGVGLAAVLLDGPPLGRSAAQHAPTYTPRLPGGVHTAPLHGRLQPLV